MKIVIADASPLNYLILIGAVDVLPRLYGRLLLPDVVLAELQDEDAPPQVSAWIAQLPAWVEVQPTPLIHIEPSLAELDAGERAAIMLAEMQASPVLLIMDEIRGRTEAARGRFATTGTLGVLRTAASRGWIDLPMTFENLLKTNFYPPRTLMAEMLREAATRRRQP